MESDDHNITLVHHRFSKNFSSSVKRCLNHAILTDVVIITEDGAERTEAHRSVLSASPLLKNLFLNEDHRYQEKVTVNFSEFLHSSVLALLQFLYTGKVELTKRTQTCVEFQNLAKQLQIDPPVNKTRKGENKQIKDEAPCAEQKTSCDMESTKTAIHNNNNVPKASQSPRGSPQRSPPSPEDQEMASGSGATIGSRRSSYTPVPLDDYASNHFEIPEENDLEDNEQANNGSEGNVQDVEARQGEFKMPDNFDIPVEIIQSQAELAGQASYAHDNPLSEPITAKNNVQENQVDSTSGQEKSDSDDQSVVTPVAENSNSESVVAISKKLQDLETKDAKNSKSKTLETPRTSKDPKRGKLIEDLFGNEEVDPEKQGSQDSKSKKSGDDDSISSILKSGSSKVRISTSQNVHQDDLEAKRKRMMRALKKENSLLEPDELVSKTYESRKFHKRKNELKRRKHSNKHICTSSCRGTHHMEEDDSWIVKDVDSGDESGWKPESDFSESEESDDDSDRSKEKASASRRRSFKEESEKISHTDEESSGENNRENSPNKSRRDRLLERREKEGLAWMEKGNGRKVKVTVQNEGEELLMELFQYRLKLLDDENSTSSSDLDESKNLRAKSNLSKQDSKKGQINAEELKRVKRKFASSSSESILSSSSDEDRQQQEPQHQQQSLSDEKKKKSEDFKRSLSHHGHERRHLKVNRKYDSKFKDYKKCLSEKKNRIELKRSFSETPGSSSSVRVPAMVESPQHIRPKYPKHEDSRKKEDHQAKKFERKNLSDLFGTKFYHSYGTSSESKKHSELQSDEGDKKVKDLMKISFKKKSTVNFERSDTN